MTIHNNVKGNSPIKPPSPKSSSRLSWTAFFYGHFSFVNFCEL